MIDNFKPYNPYENAFKNMKLAAVLVPILSINGQDHVVFETRALTLKRQPGEISFPGGKIDPGEMPEHAAIRETCEELLCHPDQVHIISPLDFYVSPGRILIHPYLGRLTYDIKTPPNKREVDEVFAVPLKYLLEYEPKIYKNRISITPEEKFPFDLIPSGNAYDFYGADYDVYFYIYKDKVIWGITAIILKNLIDHIKRSGITI